MVGGKNGMSWIRLHNGFRVDAKLKTIPIPERYVFTCLLIYAGEQVVRGTFSDEKSRFLALEVADGDQGLLTKTINDLLDLEILIRDSDGTLTFEKWMGYQGCSPSEELGANAERQRKWYQKNKASEGDSDESGEIVSENVSDPSRNLTEPNGNLTEPNGNLTEPNEPNGLERDIDKEIDVDKGKLLRSSPGELTKVSSPNIAGETASLKDLRAQLSPERQAILPQVIANLKKTPMKKKGSFSEPWVIKALIKFPKVDHLRLSEKMPEWCSANAREYQNIGYSFYGWCERRDNDRGPQNGKVTGNGRIPSKDPRVQIYRPTVVPSGNEVFDQIREHLVDTWGGGRPVIFAQLSTMKPLPVKDGVLQLQHNFPEKTLSALSIPEQVERSVKGMRLPIKVEFVPIAPA